MTDRPAPADASGNLVTRADLLRRGGVAAAGGVSAAAVVSYAGGVGAAQSAQEQRVLNLLLLVERTEVAFYREALAKAGLSGEMRQYAEVVLDHERAHLQALEQALGSATDDAPTFSFEDATATPRAFAQTAAQLEDVAVGAYNGQAGNVSPDAFLLAARIVSVEARHAAWINSIANRDPAPDAVDVPSSEAQVRSALERLGVQA